MGTAKKRIIVDDRTVARVKRANFQQDRKGKCLICSAPFQSCPHTFPQVERVIAIVHQAVEFDIRIGMTIDTPSKKEP